MNRMLKTVCAAALATVALGGLAAADYPERPVEFVVPWPPGDLEDVLTRMIAEDFQEAYGVPAAVVNRPGGGGGPFPGAISVATAPADGYTIGSFIIAIPTVGPNLGIPELSPDPFEPIGIFLTYPFVIATSGDAPYSKIRVVGQPILFPRVFLGCVGQKAIEFLVRADQVFDVETGDGEFGHDGPAWLRCPRETPFRPWHNPLALVEVRRRGCRTIRSPNF